MRGFELLVEVGLNALGVEDGLLGGRDGLGVRADARRFRVAFLLLEALLLRRDLRRFRQLALQLVGVFFFPLGCGRGRLVVDGRLFGRGRLGGGGGLGLLGGLALRDFRRLRLGGRGGFR